MVVGGYMSGFFLFCYSLGGWQAVAMNDPRRKPCVYDIFRSPLRFFASLSLDPTTGDIYDQPFPSHGLWSGVREDRVKAEGDDGGGGRRRGVGEGACIFDDEAWRT